MTPDDGYLTPREAAEYLRTSTSTLAKRRLYNDEPKFCRIGRAIRYRKSDLDDFMVRTRVKSTSEISDDRRRFMSVIRTTVSITYPRLTGVVTVRVAKRKRDDNQQPVATAFRWDVKLVPEVIMQLKWALETAKDEGVTIPGVRDRLQIGRRS